jgi:hypothetical protein
LVDRLPALPPGVTKSPIGQLRLRGKQDEIGLYALAAAAATRADGEVTALSS